MKDNKRACVGDGRGAPLPTCETVMESWGALIPVESWVARAKELRAFAAISASHADWYRREAESLAENAKLN